MDTMMTRTTLQKIQHTLSKTEHLPPAPDVLVSLLHAIDDPDSSVEMIGDLVSMDAALSLSMLRTVNSAAFGLARKVDRIQDTVVFIGLDEIKNLSIAIAMKTGLIGAAPICHTFHPKRLWCKFLTTAVASGLIGQILDRPERKVAFSAGLLKDVGLLLLDGAFPLELASVVEDFENGDLNLSKLERSAFGYTHGEVGMWLGEEWQIPRNLIAPMLYTEEPWDSITEPALCALVHIGDRLACEVTPFCNPQIEPTIDPRALEILDADPSHIDAARELLPEEMKKLAALLD